MSAYLITTGDYSDYKVLFVAPTREVAEAVAGRLDEATGSVYSSHDVSERMMVESVDDIVILPKWFVNISECDRPNEKLGDGSAAYVEWANQLGFQALHRLQQPEVHVSSHSNQPQRHGYHHGHYDWRIHTSAMAYCEEDAWKLAREAHAKTKAEVLGL